MLSHWGSKWRVWRAAQKAYADELRALLERETEPKIIANRVQPARGLTPLMAAADAKHTTNAARCVHILLAFGAEVDAVDTTKRQNTALHYAARNNKATAIGVLLAAGADAFARNASGLTALELAWRHCKREAARALMAPRLVHSGWLHVGAHISTPRWKRRWCVVLAEGTGSSAVKLCIFRRKDQVRPHCVLRFEDAAAITTPSWSILEFHVGGVKQQSMRQGIPKYRRCRQFALAAGTCEASNDRETWLRALGGRQPSALRARREDSGRSHREPGGRSQASPESSASSIPVQRDDPTHRKFESREFAKPDPVQTVTTQQIEPRECVVCMDSPQDARCSPCGHTAVCHACLLTIQRQARGLKCGGCPICRAPIESIRHLLDSATASDVVTGAMKWRADASMPNRCRDAA